MKTAFKNIRRSNRFGFSFLELMVVLVIISVILSIAAPRLQNFYKGVKLDSSARQLKMFFTLARESAVSEQKIYRIKVESGWRKMQLMEPDASEKETIRYIESDSRFSSFTLMADITIKDIKRSKGDVPEGSEFFINIHPLFSDQEVSFSFEDTGGNKLKVKLEAGGGRVSIES